jgi:hypothetical protein
MRAISSFLFPKQTLAYVLDMTTVVQGVAIPRYAFTNDSLSYKEYAVLIAWMKFF